MPQNEPVAEVEDEKEQETLSEEQETVASETGDSVADEAKDEGADQVQAKIDEAVNKALAAQAGKLAEARKEAADKARIEAEARMYKEEAERLRNPKKEPAEEKLPAGFDLLPEEVQRDILTQKRMIAELSKRDSEREARIIQIERERQARDIENVIEDMKQDSENLPGFAEVYPQIEQMAREDSTFRDAVIANPKKYLRMAYREFTAEKAPVLAEKALEEKIKKQVRAQTTRPTVRDSQAPRKMDINSSLEDAWKKFGGGL